MAQRALHTHRALLEIGFARYRVECALRNLICVRFGKVEGKEDLSGSNDFCNAQLDSAHPSAGREYIDEVVRLLFLFLGIAGDKFYPGAGQKALHV